MPTDCDDLPTAALTDLIRRASLVDPTFAVLVDTAHILRHLHDLKETIVAQMDQFNATAENLAAALADLKTRVTEDFDELKRQLAEAGVAQDAIDAATAKMQATVDAMGAVDPDPAFPAPPAEEPSEPAGDEPQPA